MRQNLHLLVLLFSLFQMCTDDCALDMNGHRFQNPQPIPTFQLESVFGKNVLSNQDLQGQYVVLDFFFTRCPSICKKMTANMARIQKELKGIDGFSMVSISIDEKNDSRSILRQYADGVQADTTKWSFLRGTRDEVFNLANAFKLGVSESDLPTSNGFEHSGTFLVINPDGKVSYHVKGDGSNDQEIDALICFLKNELTH